MNPLSFLNSRGYVMLVNDMTKRVKRQKEFKLCECGCGQQFIEKKWRRPSRPQKYIHNHHLKGSGNNHWNGGKTISRGGYIQILSPNHPNKDHHGYIMEHRLVMEKYLGRYLNKDEVIHHKNGNKQDNHIENLMLFENHSKHITFERTGWKYNK